jgi:hypothetical protein
LSTLLVFNDYRLDNIASFPVLLEDEQRHILAIAHHGSLYTDATDVDYDNTSAVRYRDQVRLREGYNARAIIQPGYPAHEQRELDAWRNQVVCLIHRRISDYQTRRISDNHNDHDDAVHSQSGTDFEHRVLNVSEILDHILDIAGPSTEITAWHVSHKWRRSAKDLIGSRSRHPSCDDSGDLVEYGQPLSTDSLDGDDANAQEFDEFRRTVRSDIDRRGNCGAPKYLFFPARLTQRKDMPDDLKAWLNELDTTQSDTFCRSWYGSVHPAPLQSRGTPSTVYWLDFSQFRFNPYFDALFDDRATQKRGMYDITLQSGSDSGNLVIDSSRYPPSLLRFLDNMFFTQPRCKVVGIYHSQDNRFEHKRLYGCDRAVSADRKSCLTLLKRVRNDSGVHIGQIIAALKDHAATVLSTWTTRAEKLANEVSTRHWQEDVWQVPGAPRFSLLLDSEAVGDEGIDEDAEIARMSDTPLRIGFENIDFDTFYPSCQMLHGHITRHCYMYADGWRQERQGEWMGEDLMKEPMVSTLRSPTNWDT